MTEILLVAMLEDPFLECLCKIRIEHPLDHHLYWKDRICCSLSNPHHRVLVLADGTAKRLRESDIISFAIWDSKVRSQSAITHKEAANRPSYRTRTCQSAHRCQPCYITKQHRQKSLNRRRNVSETREEACAASLRNADETFNSISPDRLQLELICTDPKFHKNRAVSFSNSKCEIVCDPGWEEGTAFAEYDIAAKN